MYMYFSTEYVYGCADWLFLFWVWGFGICLFVVCLPNLGHVRPGYTEYCMLRLRQLVVKLFVKFLGLLGLGGVVA